MVHLLGHFSYSYFWGLESLVEFMYFRKPVFTPPCQVRVTVGNWGLCWLGSLLWLPDVFWALINSLLCWLFIPTNADQSSNQNVMSLWQRNSGFGWVGQIAQPIFSWAWGSVVRSIREANMGVGKTPKKSPQLLPAHSVSLPSTHTLLRTNLSPRSHTHTWTRGINHRRRRSDVVERCFSFFFLFPPFY